MIVLASICTVAMADNVNLSSMSYEELLVLQKNLVKEIMSRPEWKDVKVRKRGASFSGQTNSVRL